MKHTVQLIPSLMLHYNQNKDTFQISQSEETRYHSGNREHVDVLDNTLRDEAVVEGFEQHTVEVYLGFLVF